jgi:hypothetical protein
MTRRWFRQRRERVGFYTTRYVVAEDAESAVTLAIALARTELDEQGLAAFQVDSVVVRCEQVEELDSFDDAPAPGHGFTFFPERPSA